LILVRSIDSSGPRPVAVKVNELLIAVFEVELPVKGAFAQYPVPAEVLSALDPVLPVILIVKNSDMKSGVGSPDSSTRGTT